MNYEDELEQLGERRDALLERPYSAEVSREVDRIDAEMDRIWALLEAEDA